MPVVNQFLDDEFSFSSLNNHIKTLMHKKITFIRLTYIIYALFVSYIIKYLVRKAIFDIVILLSFDKLSIRWKYGEGA